MEYRKLGHTNIDVSLICLGTMTWGEQNTEEEAHSQIDCSLEYGINFIDTAELYPVPPRKETQGLTETYLGTWLQKTKKREKVIIASKIVGPGGFVEHIRKNGTFNKEELEIALEGSLKRLQTDYIDLYQLHWPARRTNYFGELEYSCDPKSDVTQDQKNIEECLDALEKLVKSGKVRYIGLSNETAWGTMKFLELAKARNLPIIVSVQNPYNLLNRSYEIALSEIWHREKVGLLAYSPLAFGVLTGKYLNAAKPKNARLTLFKRFDRYTTEISSRATERYCAIATKYGMTPTQLALAWVNTRPFVTSNIIGATTIPQLQENIKSINIEITREILTEIQTVHRMYTNPSP